MPIIHIRSLQPHDPLAVDRALGAVAEEVAAACGCDVDDVWCTFTPVQRMTIGATPVEGEGRIAYLDVLMRPRAAGAGGQVLEAAATAVARHLGLPLEDVWAHLIPLRPGEVFAGGALLAE